LWQAIVDGVPVVGGEFPTEEGGARFSGTVAEVICGAAAIEPAFVVGVVSLVVVVT
jgi:hypothetical protein